MASSSGSKQDIVTSNFDDYNAKLQATALKVVKTSVAALPTDLSFHRSMNADYASAVDACSARILALTNKLITLASTAGASGASGGKGKARLGSRDDVVDNFHATVVDSMDQLLERADISLDQFLGRSKAPAIEVVPASQTGTKPAKPPAGQKGRLDPKLQHASHLTKPQSLFKTKPDNFSELPWQSTIRHKYNAKVPLGYVFEEPVLEMDSLATTHPYYHEIRHIQYPSRMFQHSEPVPPKSFDETPFTWVDTPAAFAEMLDALRDATEIAIDLEHHDYRTFGGFVCLMQISTRAQDWIVDTLVLREELEELNEVLTNSDIVKVFHGAESDIIWLQRDFNLYIVNLFDTYHASKLLSFPRHGLAHLLEMYCDFTPDKRYQLADWRIRPLPPPMLDYARSDTHYLLYIYDQMRNALLDRGASRSRSASPAADGAGASPPHPHDLLREALARSATTALRTHEREVYDSARGSGPNGWDTLARRWNKMGFLPSEHAAAAQRVQSLVYRAVHAWRDRTAREEDESTRYVLPNHYLFQIAERHPADMASLIAIFHPVPPIIRRRARELLDAIKDAINEGVGVVTLVQESATADSVPDGPVTSLAPVEVDGTSDAPLVLNLWSKASTANVARTSQLLGDTTMSRASVDLTTPKSALFAKQPYRTDLSVSTAFAEIVNRIHSGLVVAPTAPKLTLTPPAVDAGSGPDGVTAEADRPNVEGQAEVPFVPAARRAPREEVVDEAIVVVGQRKKRRRTVRTRKQTSSDAAADNEEASEEVFDYANTPSILDEGYEASRGQDGAGSGARGKKRKDRSAAPIAYGDFPMPPRDKREVKSGSKNMTFR